MSSDKKSLLANFSDSCRGIGSLDDTHSVEGSGRWQAYELFVFDMNGPVPPHTKETDVWAFGLIVHVGQISIFSEYFFSDTRSLGAPNARSSVSPPRRRK